MRPVSDGGVPAAHDAHVRNRSSLVVGTFNLLAPCHKRIAGSWSDRESRHPDLFEARASRAMKVMESVRPEVDVWALQEYWFDHGKLYRGMFKCRFSESFSLHSVQRTGTRPDGIGILVRRSSCEYLQCSKVRFHGAGDRVACLVKIRHRASRRVLVLISTHLTFPHNDFDEDQLRPWQLGKIQVALPSIVAPVSSAEADPEAKEAPSEPPEAASDDDASEGDVQTPDSDSVSAIVLCGDLNVADANKDFVLKYLREKMGMSSAFWSKHGHHKFVSHLNHRGAEMPSDFCFYKDGNSAGSPELQSPSATPRSWTSGIDWDKLPLAGKKKGFCSPPSPMPPPPSAKSGGPQASGGSQPPVLLVKDCFLFPPEESQIPFSKRSLVLKDVSDHVPVITVFDVLHKEAKSTSA